MEINSYSVICPYCQSECGNSDSFEGMNIWDEQYLDFECDECEKKFEGRRVVTVDYRTEKDCAMNDEEHEIGEYHCKKCDDYNCVIEHNRSRKSEGERT